MGFFRTAIYGIIFGVYAYTLHYDIYQLPRFRPSWFSKLVALTTLNFLLQVVYSTVCLICTLLDWNCERSSKKLTKGNKHHLPTYWRKSKWHEICDVMYATSAFPVGMATCLLFWVLYAINPANVMPQYVVEKIPPWYNHVTHTAPIFFLLIDGLLTCHHAPSRRVGSLVVFSLFFAYMGIIFKVRYVDGYWLYPVLDVLDTQMKVAFFATAGILLWFLYLVGDGMNTMLWGRASHEKVK